MIGTIGWVYALAVVTPSTETLDVWIDDSHVFVLELRHTSILLLGLSVALLLTGRRLLAGVLPAVAVILVVTDIAVDQANLATPAAIAVLLAVVVVTVSAAWWHSRPGGHWAPAGHQRLFLTGVAIWAGVTMVCMVEQAQWHQEGEVGTPLQVAGIVVTTGIAAVGLGAALAARGKPLRPMVAVAVFTVAIAAVVVFAVAGADQGFTKQARLSALLPIPTATVLLLLAGRPIRGGWYRAAAIGAAVLAVLPAAIVELILVALLGRFPLAGGYPSMADNIMWTEGLAGLAAVVSVLFVAVRNAANRDRAQPAPS